MTCLHLLMTFLTLTSCAFAEPTPQRLSDSMVSVEIHLGGDYGNATVIVGSGSLVKTHLSPTGYGVLTARHVIDTAEQMLQQVPSELAGTKACFLNADCIDLTTPPITTGASSYLLTRDDWAVIPVGKQSTRLHPALPLAGQDDIHLGQELQSLGFPNGEFRLVRGYVARSYIFGTHQVDLDLVVSPGASGSPAINDQGEVVCVVVSYSRYSYPGSTDPGLMLHRFNESQCAVPLL